MLDDMAIRCEECQIDEFTAIKERWGLWSDDCGELLPYCRKCARREFAPANVTTADAEGGEQRGK
jgi:hypothetical protein